MLRLIITDSSGERRFKTERDEVLVGRREGVDVLLSEPTASLNHCLLRIEAGKVRLIDLGSSNATLVNGARVTQAVLGPGESFLIGGTTVKIQAFSGQMQAAVAAAQPAAGKLTLEPDSPRPRKPAPVPRVAPEADFGREVRAILHQSPWYAISLVVHVVALLVFHLIPFSIKTKDRAATTLEALNRERLEKAEDLEKGTEPDIEDIRPEIEPLEEALEPDEAESQAVRKRPLDAEIDIEDLAPPDNVGILGGRRVKKLEIALPHSTIKGGDEQINKGDLDGEQGRATDTVKRDLGRGLTNAKRRISKDHIVVVQGNFDKIEKVLDLYDWPYTLIEYQGLAKRGYPRAKILFINCMRAPDHVYKRKLIAAVKKFVQRGGWVITSDWSIDPFISASFPDKVEVHRKHKHQPDTTVSVAPIAHDRLLQGVFSKTTRSTWWLEEASKLVRVHKDVEVLVTSTELKRRFGSNVVVFKMKYGSGRVIHLLGHFYQEDGNRMGLVGMHRLINNVIIERISPKE